MKYIFLIILFYSNSFSQVVRGINLSNLSDDIRDEIIYIDSAKSLSREQLIIRIDSLIDNSIAISTIDSAKLFYLQARLYNSINNNEKFYKNLESIVKLKFDDNEFRSQVHISLGSHFTDVANYKEALKNYYKSIDLRYESKDTLSVGDSYNSIGLMYYYSGHNKKALEFLKKAFDVYSKYDEKVKKINLNVNIGLILVELKREVEALEYFYEYLNYHKSIDSLSPKLVPAYFNIGLAHYSKLNYDQAHESFLTALKYAEEIKSTLGIAKVKYALADLYTELGKYDKAIELGEELRKININSVEFWGFNNLNLGYSYFKKGKKDYNEFFKIVEDSLNSNENLKLKENYLEFLISINEEKENYKDVLYYQRVLDTIKRKMEHDILQIQLTDLKIQYEIDESNKELIKLQYENKLNEQKISLRNNFILILILFVLLLLGMLFYIYFQNQKIAKLNNDLNESNNTIVKFFSIISHDLRSPIASYKMILDQLDDNYDFYTEEDRKNLIHESRKDVNNIYRLLENLLTWAKTSKKEININYKEINIKNEINQIIDSFSNRIKQKQLNLNKLNDNDLIFSSDKDIIHTAVRNIISNSIKFSNKSGNITIDYREGNELITIIIKDEGIGMSKEQIDNLFDIDQKSIRQGTNKENGTGLGLIIVKELLELINGKLVIESEVGKGTEVKIIIKKN